ncbi:MAG: hypothetical protein AB9866_12795 [Syntrophobacteraceae bacterium]
MIREDILRQFPELFGTKRVNGRELNVEQTIASLTRELNPEIAAALTVRRTLLNAPETVREKYAWPKWDDTFPDPVTGRSWTFRQIVQGLIDNFLGRESEWRWRLNDEKPVPKDAQPLMNPGLELTGPWHPPDMAFNALNSPAPMNMPDFEDASPPHFQPDAAPAGQPVGVFAAMKNARDIFEGRWTDRAYEVAKKGKKRAYRLNKPLRDWPTVFVRPPSIHVRWNHIMVDGQPVPGIIAVAVLWGFNNYDALKSLGKCVYFYIPKMQTPLEAAIVEKLLARIEEAIGVPPGTFKIKMLYEEGNAGRSLAAIAWVLRRRLLGTNVGRWDYLGSLIEMWKDDPLGVFPDPQAVGMASPNMIAYQRYNALMMLMSGMKDNELSTSPPIGGMAAVMIYQSSDVYGRSRSNPVAMRAIVIDKLRERILGLIFMPDRAFLSGQQPTLEEILNGNFAAAIDDYELKQRFMNDLATYRIDVSWLWMLIRHQAVITKDGWLKRPALTKDGVEPALNDLQIKAGTRFTRELFDKVWDYHNQWTAEFFAKPDRRGDPGRFDRAKASVIMELLKRQLLSPRYIQHSARVLFVVGEANERERAQILEAIFDLSREEIKERVEAGKLGRKTLEAYDYVYDVFPDRPGN